MTLKEAQERVLQAQRELKDALDELGKIAIDQRDAELRRSWYRMAGLMEEMEAQ